MDYNILLGVASIISAIGLVAICGMLLKIVLLNNKYLMIEKDIGAYEHAIRKNKKVKPDDKLSKQLNDENEWMNMMMSGVATKEQIKKFGESID